MRARTGFRDVPPSSEIEIKRDVMVGLKCEFIFIKSLLKTGLPEFSYIVMSQKASFQLFSSKNSQKLARKIKLAKAKFSMPDTLKNSQKLARKIKLAKPKFSMPDTFKNSQKNGIWLIK